MKWTVGDGQYDCNHTSCFLSELQRHPLQQRFTAHDAIARNIMQVVKEASARRDRSLSDNSLPPADLRTSADLSGGEGMGAGAMAPSNSAPNAKRWSHIPSELLTSGQSNRISGRIAAADSANVLSHEGTLAPPGEYD